MMRRNCAATLLLAWIAWTHGMFPSTGAEDWTPGGSSESLEKCNQATLTAAENTARKFQTNRGTTVTQRGAAPRGAKGQR